DDGLRMANLVKFVQFNEPLSEIIGASTDDENERQEAAQRLREVIESAVADRRDIRMRIIVKPQRELWETGVRAGGILNPTLLLSGAELEDEDLEADEGVGEEESELEPIRSGAYVAGKWGRFVRAPDFYFEIMREFEGRFAQLGELVLIRFGVKSGCDAFFMPRDISREVLEQFENPREFRKQFGIDRSAVADGSLKIIRAGDGSAHGIESEFLPPEIHSLMKVDCP